MILIADSGATKTQWRMITEEGAIRQASSEGYNPYVQEADDLRKILKESVLPLAGTEMVKEVTFYGAGCEGGERNKGVANALRPFFPQANIEVHSDLLAAFPGTLWGKPGIACILGTGSNSCFYNGKQIETQIPSLGYVLGDEGSGANMGKKIAKGCRAKEASFLTPKCI